MTLFNWLEHITVKKSHPNSFNESDWDSFNSYMIHRFISMNMDYIEIANYTQRINPQNKKQIYTIYRDLLPKQKMWFKYIKPEKSKDNKELIGILTKYFECSTKEVKEYLELLSKKEIKSILKSMGMDDKEIKKLKV